MLRSVDKEKATGPFFLTLPLNASSHQQNKQWGTCETCHRRKSCRGAFPDGQHLPLIVVPLPHSRNIGEPTKQRKPSSKVYPGGEAYIDISQNADEISRLISIGRKNNDGLSILERETRNNMTRSFQVLP